MAPELSPGPEGERQVTMGRPRILSQQEEWLVFANNSADTPIRHASVIP
jgi:hypothetical protein